MLWDTYHPGGIVITHCTQLRDLKTSLAARDVPKKTSEDVCNIILISPQLPDPPICDARLVVDFLVRHLPSVTHVDVYFIGTPSIPYDLLEEYGSLWHEVNEHLQMNCSCIKVLHAKIIQSVLNT